MPRAVIAATLAIALGCGAHAPPPATPTDDGPSPQDVELQLRLTAQEARLAALETKLTLMLDALAALDAAPAAQDGVAGGALPPPPPPPPPPRPIRTAPDPQLTYAVPVVGAPSEGPDDALVTIVEFSEYACPYCEKVRPTLATLRSTYGNLRVVHLGLVVHPANATVLGLRACAAHRQGVRGHGHAPVGASFAPGASTPTSPTSTKQACYQTAAGCPVVDDFARAAGTSTLAQHADTAARAGCARRHRQAVRGDRHAGVLQSTGASCRARNRWPSSPGSPTRSSRRPAARRRAPSAASTTRPG
ncbi:MAG: hypothetical protein R2939_18225 [Kofleriaceae bacterium]